LGGGDVLIGNTGAVTIDGAVTTGGGQFVVGSERPPTEAASFTSSAAIDTRHVGQGANGVGPGGIVFIMSLGNVAVGGAVTTGGGKVTIDAAGQTVSIGATLDPGSGGYLLTAATVQILSGGVLDGGGTVNGNLVNGGTIHPGAGGATVTVKGNFTQQHGGTLQMDLAGTAAGQFDQLVISGSLTLDGTLTVQETGGFASKPGDKFDILTDFTNHTGNFSTTKLTLDARQVETTAFNSKGGVHNLTLTTTRR
jgi:hypothetical protein